jgi:hypothetical protein
MGIRAGKRPGRVGVPGGAGGLRSGSPAEREPDGTGYGASKGLRAGVSGPEPERGAEYGGVLAGHGVSKRTP